MVQFLRMLIQARSGFFAIPPILNTLQINIMYTCNLIGKNVERIQFF